MPLTKNDVIMLRFIFSTAINPRNMESQKVLIDTFGLDEDSIDVLIKFCDWISNHELYYALFGHEDLY